MSQNCAIFSRYGVTFLETLLTKKILKIVKFTRIENSIPDFLEIEAGTGHETEFKRRLIR